MTAMNFFSHGTQDFYPTFLQEKHRLGPAVVSGIAIAYNIGAVIGSFLFGSLSQRFGRRRTMIAAALLALSTVWLWAYSPTLGLLALGAFLINLFVQGCWSIIPVHLNELSPAGAARHLSRHRLPARQSGRVQQSHAAGLDRRENRQLQSGAGFRRHCREPGDHSVPSGRPRSAQRGDARGGMSRGERLGRCTRPWANFHRPPTRVSLSSYVPVSARPERAGMWS